MQAEKSVEQYLIRRVKACGGMCIKLQCTGINGIPDRIVLIPSGKIPSGKSVFVELKAPGGRLSAVQEVRIKQLQDMGFSVYVLYNFEQVDNFIDKEMIDYVRKD